MYRRVRGRWRYREKESLVVARRKKKGKGENTFFHKRAKTFPRDPLSFSLSPRVPHVYRFTVNVKE